MKTFRIFSGVTAFLTALVMAMNTCALAAYKKGENIAPMATMTASRMGDDGSSDPKYINDGIVTPEGTGTTKWFIMNSPNGVWAQFDFQNHVMIKGAKVITGNTRDAANPDIITDFKFQFQKDGNWIDIPGSIVNNNLEFEVNVLFDVAADSNAFRIVSLTDSRFRIREIELYEAVESSDVYVQEGTGIMDDYSVEEDYKNYYNLLFNTGILEEKWLDGTTPQSIVTRQQFVEMLLDFFGYAYYDQHSATIFKDVRADGEGSGAIAYATSLGWIGKFEGENFNGKSEIKYIDACQMILSAFGYDILANSNGGYPVGYQILASELKLLNGLNLRKDGYIRLGDTLAILYNAADANVVEMREAGRVNTYFTERKFLERYYDIYEFSGVVQSTYLIHISTPVKMDAVMIDGRYFNTGTTDVGKYFGQNVRVWYDKEDVLVNVERGRNNVLQVDASLVDGSSSSMSEIPYFDESGKRRKAQINREAYFFHNGIHMSGTPGNYNFNEGEYVFIDNNNDGLFDIVQINSWENYIVSSIDSAAEKIYTNANVTVDLSDAAYVVISNNKSISIGDIVKDDVVTVQMSRDNTSAKVYVSRDKFRGEVTELLSDDVQSFLTVDGKQYELTGQAKEIMKEAKKANLSGRYFLNFVGKIVYIDQITSIGFTNALLIAANVNNTGLAPGEIKVLDEAGVVRVLPLSNTINMNGHRTDVGKLQPSTLQPFTFIRYSLNETGQVIRLNCEESGVITTEPITYDDDGVYRFDDLSGSYYARRSVLLDNDRERVRHIFLNNDTLTFTVSQRDLNNEKYYQVTKGNSIGYSGRNVEGQMKVYNVDDSGTAAVLVHITNRMYPIVDSSIAISVVEKKTTISGVESGEGVRLYLYEEGQRTFVDIAEDAVYNPSVNQFLGSFNSYSSVYSNVPAAELECGDVIQYSKDKDGKLASYRILMRARDADKNSPVQFGGGEGSMATYYPPLETYIGTLESYTEDTLAVSSGGKVYRTVFAVPNVYIVDTKKGIVYIGNLDDVIAKKYDTSSNLNTFFRMNENQIDEIVIYE